MMIVGSEQSQDDLLIVPCLTVDLQIAAGCLAGNQGDGPHGHHDHQHKHQNEAQAQTIQHHPHSYCSLSRESRIKSTVFLSSSTIRILYFMLLPLIVRAFFTESQEEREISIHCI